ncbi:MAG: glycoside hydrolase family 57 protein [Methylacidiphilales bacterium]|nr:glycoside hydrolase family 57 protein [Candidatus Methylacidiphilales bacterium]MDW8350110.1 glycoside hydrolase family 57 protein [Verrucomicrobiae bacterium]
MNVVLLWHMHQPYYVDPLTKRAKMPWVRLHAVKGYLDMIDVLSRTPEIHVNVNFTPVLVRQILELVNGEVTDEWLEWSERDAGDLPESYRRSILQNFFKANWDHLIKPFPRYWELLQARGALLTDRALKDALAHFTEQDYRDLQVWYNLAWCGFSACKRFPELTELKQKGRDFTEDDKKVVLAVHRKILGMILNLYREASERGQIELTTTPYFHPIMPLVYDTNIARRCMPQAKLPRGFSAPEDVRTQLHLAQELHQKVFGHRAKGMWPSEGSICPEIIPLMREAGIEYFCSDEGNLFKSLEMDPEWSQGGKPIDHLELFQGWEIAVEGASIRALFRERPLSDFVGFNAARNEPQRAIDYLIHHCVHIGQVRNREDTVVCLALDGENAWEAFPDGGEAFLDGWYKASARHPSLRFQKMGDYFSAYPPRVTARRLHSGSWIGSDFDIWIGDEEENKAWDWLTHTREFLVESLHTRNLLPERVELAWWSIYAAEGSDWFWWYGPDFTTDSDVLFDDLFRTHLKNVYLALGVEPPGYLDIPICVPSSALPYREPRSPIKPPLTGRDESYFDWVGAGYFDIRQQQTAMFQGERKGQALYFGYDAEAFFLRVDFSHKPLGVRVTFMKGVEMIRIEARPHAEKWKGSLWSSRDGVNFEALSDYSPSIGWSDYWVMALPWQYMGAQPGERWSFYVELWEDGLAVERYPERGAIEFECPHRDYIEQQWIV